MSPQAACGSAAVLESKDGQGHVLLAIQRQQVFTHASIVPQKNASERELVSLIAGKAFLAVPATASLWTYAALYAEAIDQGLQDSEGRPRVGSRAALASPEHSMTEADVEEELRRGQELVDQLLSHRSEGAESPAPLDYSLLG